MCETSSRRVCSGPTPELWPDKWILHHENTLVHSALRVCKFVTKKSHTKINHSPHSSHLAPAIFGSLEKLKSAFKEQRFVES
jgi:hypothetical protein